MECEGQGHKYCTLALPSCHRGVSNACKCRALLHSMNKVSYEMVREGVEEGLEIWRPLEAAIAPFWVWSSTLGCGGGDCSSGSHGWTLYWVLIKFRSGAGQEIMMMGRAVTAALTEP